MSEQFAAQRDSLLISTKAGHLMWEGPYGDWGSKKHLTASLDQSLKRMRLDYVDIFYSHRPDPDTPIEETVSALVQAVRSGKALYIGLSKYPPALLKQACALLREERIPCLIHQFRYNLLDRSCEEEGLATLREEQLGSIVFSPLAQGQLTGKYLEGMNEDSRAKRNDSPFLNEAQVSSNHAYILKLNEIAKQADISLTELSLRWLLQREEVSSVLIGARNISQLNSCAAAAGCAPLSEQIMSAINAL